MAVSFAVEGVMPLWNPTLDFFEIFSAAWRVGFPDDLLNWAF
jgi:hypothetical protein